MRLLSFDTVTPWVSIAVVSDGELRYEKTWNVGRRHSTEVPRGVQEALAASNIDMNGIDGIVVGSGPGSYTGIRIGIALAKGLAMASGCPLVAISSLEAVACEFGAREGVITALAGLGPELVVMSSFAGPWDSWTRLSDDQGLPVSEVEATIPEGAFLCGWGDQLSRMTLRQKPSGPALTSPRAEILAFLGQRRFDAGASDEVDTVEPNYLRLSAPEERANLAEVNH